jgi:hypothetical protein
MAVRTQCPRCKQPLSVPNKLAGSYVTCPRCQGRFWVSKDSPADPSISDSVAMPSLSTLASTAGSAATPPVAIPPVATPPGRPPASTADSLMPASAATVQTTEPPRQHFPSVTPPASVSPGRLAPALPVPSDEATNSSGNNKTSKNVPPLPFAEEAPASTPGAPPQALKVARLVSADTTQSSLKLAADGQLPHLQLQEDDKKTKGDGKSKSIPPAVMILVWVASVVISAVLVITLNTGESTVTTAKRKEALAVIEKDFSGDPARGSLLPYQRLLRQASQAHARGDFTAERQYYKQVLDLLHTAPRDGSGAVGHLQKGITGSQQNDDKLKEKILAVLEE